MMQRSYLRMTTPNSVSSQQRHGILPHESHPLQEHTLHLLAPRRRRQPVRCTIARVRLHTTPVHGASEVEFVVDGSLADDSVCGHDPEVWPGDVGVLVLVELEEGPVLVPDI